MNHPSDRRRKPSLLGGLALAYLLLMAASCRPADFMSTAAPTVEQPPVPPEPTVTAPAQPSATASPQPTGTPACRQGAGGLDQESYQSPLQSQEVPVWVYRPACYDALEAPLPVIYFLHGKPYDEEHWVSLGLVEIYEAGLRREEWGQALLVLPRLPEPLFSRSDGGPGSYEQEFIEGLLPYIESSYRVAGGRQDRRLAGISRGGIWALEIGLRHSGRFEAVAALSPSLAVNYPRPAYDPFELAADSSLPVRMLLLAGDEDWARAETERLAGQLAAEATELETSTVPGDHSDPTWSAALPDVLQFLLRGIEP